jgi:hypothetical protein
MYRHIMFLDIGGMWKTVFVYRLMGLSAAIADGEELEVGRMPKRESPSYGRCLQCVGHVYKSLNTEEAHGT